MKVDLINDIERRVCAIPILDRVRELQVLVGVTLAALHELAGCAAAAPMPSNLRHVLRSLAIHDDELVQLDGIAALAEKIILDKRHAAQAPLHHPGQAAA